MSGDMDEGFRQLKELRRERHAEWRSKNMAYIRQSKLSFTDRGSALLFRLKGHRRADFYPDTGRWKDCETSEMHQGGAEAFVKWLTETPLDEGDPEIDPLGLLDDDLPDGAYWAMHQEVYGY